MISHDDDDDDDDNNNNIITMTLFTWSSPIFPEVLSLKHLVGLCHIMSFSGANNSCIFVQSDRSLP